MNESDEEATTILESTPEIDQQKFREFRRARKILQNFTELSTNDRYIYTTGSMSTTKFKGIQTRRRQTILLKLLGANTSTTNRYTNERINTIIEYDIETKRLFDTDPIFDNPGWHAYDPQSTIDDANLQNKNYLTAFLSNQQNKRLQSAIKLQRWYRRLGTKSITDSIKRTNSMLIPLLETYALPTSGIKRFDTPEKRLKMLENLEMLETKILKRFDTNFNLQNKRLQSVTKLQRWFRRLRTEELQLEELLKKLDNPTPAQIKANEKIRKQNKEQSRLLHEQIYNNGWYGNTNQRQKRQLIKQSPIDDPIYSTLLSRLLSSEPRTVKEIKEKGISPHNDYTTTKLHPSKLREINEETFEQSPLHEQVFGLLTTQTKNITFSQASNKQKRKLMHNELLHKTKDYNRQHAARLRIAHAARKEYELSRTLPTRKIDYQSRITLRNAYLDKRTTRFINKKINRQRQNAARLRKANAAKNTAHNEQTKENCPSTDDHAKNNKTRYVFKTKSNSNDTINVFKTRPVSKGYMDLQVSPTCRTPFYKNLPTTIGTTGTIAITITMSLLIIYGLPSTLQLIFTSFTLYMTLILWEQMKLCKHCLSRHSGTCQHNPDRIKTYDKWITNEVLNAKYKKLIEHSTLSNWITRKRILKCLQPTTSWTNVLLSPTKPDFDNYISEQELKDIFIRNKEDLKFINNKRQQELKNSHDLFKTFEAIN